MKYRLVYWMPRILCIAAILYMSIFALDAFQPTLTIWQQIGGFIMHLIPSIVLLLLLIIVWKRELAGGIIFIVAGIIIGAWIIDLHIGSGFPVKTTILTVASMCLPFIVAGIFFIAGHRMRRNLDQN